MQQQLTQCREFPFKLHKYDESMCANELMYFHTNAYISTYVHVRTMNMDVAMLTTNFFGHTYPGVVMTGIDFSNSAGPKPYIICKES